jgi:uncharacterized membrane protein YobD (UPF0266 family)
MDIFISDIYFLRYMALNAGEVTELESGHTDHFLCVRPRQNAVSALHAWQEAQRLIMNGRQYVKLTRDIYERFCHDSLLFGILILILILNSFTSTGIQTTLREIHCGT